MRLADSIRRVSNADGGVVMDLRKGTMFQVNPLGVRVLDLLDEQRSFAEIANQVSTEFGISLEVVRTDVAEYFDALAAHGVLDPSWSRD